MINLCVLIRNVCVSCALLEKVRPKEKLSYENREVSRVEIISLFGWVSREGRKRGNVVGVKDLRIGGILVSEWERRVGVGFVVLLLVVPNVSTYTCVGGFVSTEFNVRI